MKSLKPSLPCLAILVLLAHPLSAQVTDTVYFNDFELNDGGLVTGGFGDWEWGPLTLQLDTSCESTNPLSPPMGFSGQNAWANNIDGCYMNASDSSTIALVVDLSNPSYSSAALSWINWYDVFTAWDHLWMTVNGDPIYQNNSTANIPAWDTESYSLDAYLGQSNVQIEFGIFATAVVNRAGWYIDDLLVTATNGSIGIEELHNLRVAVWPNPATDMLNIKVENGDKNTRVAILSSLGQLVDEAPLNGSGSAVHQFDVQDLVMGVYSVMVSTERGTQVKRIVIR